MIKIKKVIIFSNGNLNKSYISFLCNRDFIIGVDRAAHWLIQNRIHVDAAIGDFDSTSPEEMNVIRSKIKKIIVFPPEKDQIDTELALKYAVNFKSRIIDIYGGFGSRMDHTLASIMLLEPHSSHNIEIRLIDDKNIIQLINKKIIIKKDPSLPYFSLISLTKLSKVTIIGSKYDITRAAVCRGQSLGISNEIKSNQTQIMVHKGKVLLIRSRD